MTIDRSLIRLGLLALLPVTLSACNSSSSESVVTGIADPLYKLSSSGGLGGMGGAASAPGGATGGSAGRVSIEKVSSTGNVEILKSGKVDASFAAQTPALNLGSNPLIVGVDTVVEALDPSAAEPLAGTPYLVISDTSLRISDGNGTLADEPAVSGLSIGAGARLSLGLNLNGTTSNVFLTHDIENLGVLSVADASTLARGHLALYCASYIAGAGASIDTQGLLDGQGGGNVNITAYLSLYNHGTLSATGADHTQTDGQGGRGGDITLSATYTLQNTGAITSDGGNAPLGVPGSAGKLTLRSQQARLQNSAVLALRGGIGASGAGDGGRAQLSGGRGLRNAGLIDTRGADAQSGNGGAGGGINLSAKGGDLLNGADLFSAGGAAQDVVGNGGRGASLNINLSADYRIRYGVSSGDYRVGDLLVSGHIDSTGGDALVTGSGIGGAGGEVNIHLDPRFAMAAQRLALIGYAGIDAKGGDASQGGNGGAVRLVDVMRYGPETIALIQYGVGGDVINEAAISTRGGDVLADATFIADSGGFAGQGGRGGEGGAITLSGTSFGVDYLPELMNTINRGTLDSSAGSSFNNVANLRQGSGAVTLWGYGSVSNSAAISADGSRDGAADGGADNRGKGGYARQIEMGTSIGAVNNTGVLSANGGNGELSGGYSNGIYLYGTRIINTAALSGNGGNADVALVGSTGGFGGAIELISVDGYTAVDHRGSASYLGGTGETVGTEGGLNIGGICVSGTCASNLM